VLTVSVPVVSYGSVSLAIVPDPPLALNVMVAVVVLAGAIGVTNFDGAE
jgi:hypothetical protein